MNTLCRIFMRHHDEEAQPAIHSDHGGSKQHAGQSEAGVKLAVTVLCLSSINASMADSVWQGPVDGESDWFLLTGAGEFRTFANWAGGLPGPATATTTVDNGGTAVIFGNNPITGGGADAGTTLIVDNRSSVYLRGGSLTVENLELGQTGTGIFNQDGGILNAAFVALGNLTGSTGIYNLRDGSLTVANEFVGFGGTGFFNQTGGTHSVSGTLTVASNGNQGTYTLGGGTLNATTETIGTGAGSIGIFNHTGGTHTVSNTLTIGQSGGQGTYNLSGDGSSLTVLNERIGRGSGVGRFTQTGGTHTVTGILRIGTSQDDPPEFGGSGAYVLNSGILNAANEIVADGRTGAFTQTGGAHTVSGLLQIGLGERGTYDLGGTGTLTASNENIGNFGTGIFTQTGGSHRVDGTLNIGLGSGTALVAFGRGTYVLNDGSLTVTDENIGRNDPVQESTDVAQGTFIQNGGTHTVSGTLRIGGANGVQGTGTYDLNGGNLSARNEIIGDGGTGTFTQFGGIHTVGDSLTIGPNSTYALFGGALSTPNALNNGAFSQSGGSIATTRFTNNSLYTYTGGTFAGDFLNNGTAIFNPVERSIFGANISGDGALLKEGGATLILTGRNSYSGGSLVTSGVLQGNTDSLQGNITNNATVVFDQAATGIYAGNISGEGNVVKENTGLLIFNGNSTYTGGTQVAGGNLQVGDATHPGASILGLVNVGPNGTLSGHGTIAGNVDNAGTVAPGGSIGTLTVEGDVTFQSGSTFQTEIDPTQSSRLNVTGLASLGNAQVDVVAADGAYGPNRYTILSAGSIAGRFLDQVTSNFASIDPLLTPTLEYDDNNVYLDLNPVRLQDPMGGATKVATNTIYMIDRLVTGRFNAPLGELCSTPTLGFWGRGIGMLSSASASGDEPGYNGGTSGFVLGIDGQPTERLSLGIVGFSAHSDVTTNARFIDRSTVNMAGFNLYGAYTDDAWQFRSALGYSNESYSSQQIITAGSQQRRAQGSTEANRLSNYTEGSYTFKAGVLSVQPLLAMQFGWMEQNGFTQNGLFGDGQGLNVNSRTQYVLDTLAGARARQDFPISESMKAQVELRALYMHQFGTLQNSTGGSLTGGQSVSLGTQDRPGERDAGILGAGITLLTANSINVYMDYNAQILSSQTSSFFSAGLRYAW